MNLMKALRMKRVNCGSTTMYEGRPFWNVRAHIIRLGNAKWRAVIEDKNDDAPAATVFDTFKLRRHALTFIANYGGRMTTTTNILNPKAGEIPIALSLKGGCCDPGTETYHCM